MMTTRAKQAEKKQEKADRKAAGEIISALNDFLSRVNDVSSEYGYDIPEVHAEALSALHHDLSLKFLGE